MTLTLGFHGGAGTVTGSRFLLTAGQHQALVDCGLFQGLKNLREMNWRRTGFDPRAVDSLILTHAHIDHCGYLPRFVRDGFRGPIYCTRATAELAPIVLMDAAKLQEEDADFANRKGFSKHHPALPLFNTRDVENALRHLRPVPYGREVDLPGGFAATFHNAGHILGSAHVQVQTPREHGHTRIVFSGDVGRHDMPLHIDPEPLPLCDTLVLESTYGGRHHDPAPLEEQLRKPFDAAIRRGGTILIPAFAVARAQLVTLMLDDLMDRGELPRIPIHIDSPMAADVTEIYERHLTSGELDPGTGEPRRGRLFPPGVRLHRTVAESRQLNDLDGPRIIIASSGMLTGGRILHHLARLVGDDKNLLVLVGYQAAGTRGRRLLEGQRTMRIHGQDIPVNCHWISVDGLSAHADEEGLVEWVKSAPHKPATIFLAHGEPDAADALAARLTAAGYHPVVPQLDQEYEFIPSSRHWRQA